MSVSLTSTKNGLEQLVKQLEGLNAKDVYVGIPESKNTTIEGEQFNLATLAAILDRGNQHIKPRPFLHQTLIENQQKYTALFAEGINNGEDYVTLMERIALIVQGDVQKNIKDGDWIENRPSTIKRKGSSKPLIDTGHLRKSITGIIK